MHIPYTKNGINEYQNMIPRLYPEIKEEFGSAHTTLVVTFVVTQNCNLRCTYCYQHNKNEKNSMSFETAKASIDRLFEEYNKNEQGKYIKNKEKQAVILEFIGGEPLLEVELIEKIIQYFRYKAYVEDSPWLTKHMCAISTNGLNFLTPQVQKFVGKYKDALSISISIDGNKELHDACRLTPSGGPSYDIVAASFRKLCELYPDPLTKMTLAPENINYLFEAHKNLIEEFNVGHIFSNVVYEEGWTTEHAKIMYIQMKELADYLLETGRYKTTGLTLFDYSGTGRADKEDKNWCGGTGEMIAFDTDGKFYPCLRYVPFSLKPGIEPLVIGDIHTGFAEKKEELQVVQLLTSITKSSQSEDKCLSCEIATGCGWCSAYNYEKFGTPNKRATFHCQMHQARVLANAYFWNKLLNRYDPKRVKYPSYPMNIKKDWALEIINENEYNMLKELTNGER